VADTVRGDVVQAVSEVAEGFGHGGDRRRAHACIDDQVEVSADPRRRRAVLERVQQHHLAADERPVLGAPVGDLRQGDPQLVAQVAERRKVDHRRSSRAARTLRSSPASRRSAPTTNRGACRSPSANGHAAAGTRRTTLLPSPWSGGRKP
jgi:hypothetical protein